MIHAKIAEATMRALLLAALITFAAAPARAQEHRHPPQDAPLHEKFYNGWMQPDQPEYSCCNLMDCYPTAAKFERGKWLARHRETGDWLEIPDAKIERNRDMPDGRAHLCASPGKTVFCFGSGGGS